MSITAITLSQCITLTNSTIGICVFVWMSVCASSLKHVVACIFRGH
jgi:hypothetical protein